MEQTIDIKRFLKDGLGNVWTDGKEGKGIDLDVCAGSIIRAFKLAGYRLIPELKVLTHDEIMERYKKWCEGDSLHGSDTFADEVAQATLDDIKKQIEDGK